MLTMEEEMCQWGGRAILTCMLEDRVEEGIEGQQSANPPGNNLIEVSTA